MRSVPARIALCIGLAGCSSAELPGGRARAADSSEPRVVLTILDTAFNPYHEYFYAGSPIYASAAPASVTPAVLAEFDIPPERQVQLTRTGDIARDIAADQAFWSSVQRHQHYWFKGTNVIAIADCADDLPPLVPHAGKVRHGVATTAAALRANPEVIVRFIEDCSVGTLKADEMAMLDPSTDITSYSFVTLGPLPLPFPYTYESVVRRGTLHFNSAGNEPNFTPIQSGPGDWWTIGVSGIEEDGSRGQTIQSSNFPDFVSDYRDDLPYCLDCESGLEHIGGTSFSSPRAAGVASKVLLTLRRMLGHAGRIVPAADGRPALVAAGGHMITNWDLRRALEEAAYVDYAMTDYDPLADGDQIPVSAVPVNDAAPWLQLAWGDLSADPAKGVVAETLAHLGFGTPSRTKDPGFCDFQSANIRLRQSYWDAVGGASRETVPNPNPFQFCGSDLSP